MGMFDWVICNYELPSPPKNKLQFQTKSLSRNLDEIIIAEDGRLWTHEFGDKLEDDYIFENKFTGILTFYGGNMCGSANGYSFTPDGADAEDVTYTAQFDNGKLIDIKCIAHTFTPAKPMTDWGKYAYQSTDGQENAQ
jgi:hypothetical protein